MNSTVEAKASAWKGVNPEMRAQLKGYLEQQNPLIRALHGLMEVCKVATVLLNVGLLVLAVWISINALRLGAEGLPVGAAWAAYGLSWSLFVFWLALDVIIIRVFPLTFLGAVQASKAGLITGGGAVWRGLLVLLGGMPGAVYMVTQFGEALSRLIQAL